MEPSARRTCNAAAHQCVHDNPASSGALLPKAVPRLCIRCAQGVLDSLAPIDAATRLGARCGEFESAACMFHAKKH
jgi:hypothetical protein